MTLAHDLLPLLRRIVLLPRLLVLDTPGVRATVPVLRGVWGAALLPDADRPAWDGLQTDALALARRRPAGPWQGSRLDLTRWSARQEAEIDLHGVAGDIDLPAGPGDLWPLLAAASWLHLGKGTALGLGQVCVHPLPADEHGGP